jgi:hypothetical protein
VAPAKPAWVAPLKIPLNKGGKKPKAQGVVP